MIKIFTLELQGGTFDYEDYRHRIYDVKPSYDQALTSLLTYLAGIKQGTIKDDELDWFDTESVISDPVFEEVEPGHHIASIHPERYGYATIREWTLIGDDRLDNFFMELGQKFMSQFYETPDPESFFPDEISSPGRMAEEHIEDHLYCIQDGRYIDGTGKGIQDMIRSLKSVKDLEFKKLTDKVSEGSDSAAFDTLYNSGYRAALEDVLKMWQEGEEKEDGL